MSYVISPDEAPGKATRRILLELTGESLALLERWEDDPVAHIHRVRQNCKKARALLRLVRPGARYVFAVENRFYRDIQRSLAYARDADAMVEALELLEQDLADPLPLQSLRMLKAALARRAFSQARSAREHLAAQIGAVVAELAPALDRLQGLPVNGLSRRDLKRGARRTLARCARDFHRLPAGEPGEQFHEWRKQVKHVLYQARLMRELLPEQCEALRAPMKELSGLLGHSQDLKILEDFLREQPDALGIDTHLRRLFALMARAQARLRSRAQALGEQIFATDAQVSETGTPQGSGPYPICHKAVT